MGAEEKCGFCRLGREVEADCGTLHVSGPIAAHHKCMQYSALLIQYKKKDFGGFKHHRVDEEIKRGRYLKCQVCRKDKKKSTAAVRGATAGCAYQRCQKTYHFLCANKDSSASTARLVVRREDREVVNYRAFCSPEHREMYMNDGHDRGVEKDVSDSEDEEESTVIPPSPSSVSHPAYGRSSPDIFQSTDDDNDDDDEEEEDDEEETIPSTVLPGLHWGWSNTGQSLLSSPPKSSPLGRVPSHSPIVPFLGSETSPQKGGVRHFDSVGLGAASRKITFNIAGGPVGNGHTDSPASGYGLSSLFGKSPRIVIEPIDFSPPRGKKRRLDIGGATSPTSSVSNVEVLEMNSILESLATPESSPRKSQKLSPGRQGPELGLSPLARPGTSSYPYSTPAVLNLFKDSPVFTSTPGFSHVGPKKSMPQMGLSKEDEIFSKNTTVNYINRSLEDSYRMNNVCEGNDIDDSIRKTKALVVIGEECDTSKVFKQSLSIIEENYAVAAEDVVLWSELPHEHPLPITYTPPFMKDISSALRDPGRLRRLVLQVEPPPLAMYAQSDELDKSLWKTINANLDMLTGTMGQRVGGLHRLSDQTNHVHLLIVLLNGATDPKAETRKRIERRRRVCQILPSASLRHITSNDSPTMPSLQKVEQARLAEWLLKGAGRNYKTYLRPLESILRTDNPHSVTHQLKQYFILPGITRDVAFSENDSPLDRTAILFIGPVDESIVQNPMPYCKKAILEFVQDNQASFARIFCIFDVVCGIGFGGFTDMLSGSWGPGSVKVWSAFHPAELTVSCAILEFSNLKHKDNEAAVPGMEVCAQLQRGQPSVRPCSVVLHDIMKSKKYDRYLTSKRKPKDTSEQIPKDSPMSNKDTRANISSTEADKNSNMSEESSNGTEIQSVAEEMSVSDQDGSIESKDEPTDDVGVIDLFASSEISQQSSDNETICLDEERSEEGNHVRETVLDLKETSIEEKSPEDCSVAEKNDLSSVSTNPSAAAAGIEITVRKIPTPRTHSLFENTIDATENELSNAVKNGKPDDEASELAEENNNQTSDVLDHRGTSDVSGKEVSPIVRRSSRSTTASTDPPNVPNGKSQVTKKKSAALEKNRLLNERRSSPRGNIASQDLPKVQNEKHKTFNNFDCEKTLSQDTSNVHAKNTEMFAKSASEGTRSHGVRRSPRKSASGNRSCGDHREAKKLTFTEKKLPIQSRRRSLRVDEVAQNGSESNGSRSVSEEKVSQKLSARNDSSDFSSRSSRRTRTGGAGDQEKGDQFQTVSLPSKRRSQCAVEEPTITPQRGSKAAAKDNDSQNDDSPVVRRKSARFSVSGEISSSEKPRNGKSVSKSTNRTSPEENTNSSSTRRKSLRSQGAGVDLSADDSGTKVTRVSKTPKSARKPRKKSPLPTKDQITPRGPAAASHASSPMARAKEVIFSLKPGHKHVNDGQVPGTSGIRGITARKRYYRKQRSQSPSP